jgi:6,7-dimethyl-8-ribityllumazine synthase
MKVYKNTDMTGVVQSFPIAVIVSLFNRDITQPLQDGAIEHLKKRGFKDEDICVVEVPGAIEIPYVARVLAATKRYEAIIALGSIVHGETNHYTWVGSQVSSDCFDVSKEFNIPVIFGVLTTEHSAQAWDALGGKFGHKGVNCVDYAITMHHLSKQINADK